MKAINKIFRWRTIGYAFFLLVFTVLAAEIILRIYNPFPFRLKGTDVLLPRNQRYRIDNTHLPGLDSVIIHTKNSLGFRGPELPAKPDSFFSVMTVGGSTTECWTIREEDSWPYLLSKKLEQDFQSLWLNNAGISGASSRSHYLLIRQYIKQLHPKVVFLLVGWNDVFREDMTREDAIDRDHYTDFRNFLGKKSELYNLVVNIKRHHEYKEYGKITGYDLLITKDHPLLFKGERFNDSLLRTEAPNLAAYRKRIDAIVDTLRNNGILPVLMTQPGMMGHGIDSLTGCNLDDYRMFRDISGKVFATCLDEYNKITMEVAREKAVFCIDLARLLPANSSNFYDVDHYNKKGCKEVAQIVYDQSIAYLKSKFPDFLKN